MRQISIRLEILEQSYADLMAETKADLTGMRHDAPHQESIPSRPAAPLEALARVHAESSDDPITLELSASEAPAAEMASDTFVQHAFANHFEMSADFADALAQPVPANEQDFLESARRSTQAAAESDARHDLRGLGWNKPVSRAAENPRPAYLVILAGIVFPLLAAAVVLMLSQRSAHNPLRFLPKLVTMGHSSTAMPRLKAAQQTSAP